MVRKQLKAEGGPLMPAAEGAGQHELEAALLVALNTAARQARGRGGAATGLPLVSQVRLATRALWLEVAEEAVNRLLAHSLPVIGANGATGIPGLRPRAGRDHLELRLIGSDGKSQGHVRLLGVNRTRWRDAVRYLEDRHEADEQLWLDCRDELDSAERVMRRSLASQPIRLMSAVLRRSPLWRQAAWVDSAVVGDSLEVRWEDGPRDAVVAAILADSACRIPGVSVAPEQLSDVMRNVIVSYAEVASQAHCEPEWAWSELQKRGIPASQGREESSAGPLGVSVVAPEVWDQQEMREALARQEISSVFRLLRRHGVSQRQIAALTGQSQPEVSEILKGRQVVDRDVLTRIALGLGVPRGYIGLAYDEATAARVAAAADSTLSDESVKRRKFLAHAAAMSAHTEGSSWVTSGLRWPAPCPDRLEMADVRQVESAVRALRALEWQYGGASGREAAAAQLAWSRSLLNAPGTDDVKDRLNTALAALQRLADSTAEAQGTGQT